MDDDSLDDLAALCRACGLCCDGSLFGRVSLERAEVARARRNRLRVVASGRAIDQPCSALAEGEGAERTCAVYSERPAACRRFECRLYDRHRREGGPLGPRMDAVRRVRELLAWLEASGLGPGEFEGEPASEAGEAYRELVRRLEEDFARA